MTTALKEIFGEDYIATICSLYTLADGKSPERIVDDVWHALFWFDDEDKLKQWAADRLRLSDDDAARFAAISTSRDTRR